MIQENRSVDFALVRFLEPGAQRPFKDGASVFMLPRRYALTIANLRSGTERRITLSLPPALVILVSIVTLPVLMGVGVAWQVSADAQRLRARNRTLEIETANYRATTEALTGRIESLQASIPVLGGEGSRAPRTSPTTLPPARTAT